jgi:isochorismate synthase
LRESLLKYTQELLDKKLPFLILRPAGSQQVKVLHQTDQMLHTTAPDKLTYGVFSEFLKTNNQIFIYGQVSKCFRFESDNTIDLQTDANVYFENPSAYENIIAQAVKSIQETALDKVVISHRKSVVKTKDNLLIFQNLLYQYQKANCYFFFHPEVGKWMGATPEILLSYNDCRLSTMSLAGTQKYPGTMEVAWGKKEKEEQQLVTDYIVNTLQETEANNIQVGPVHTFKAGDLLHLKTIITANISLSAIEHCLELLHPTPAVCGMPREQALSFIKNNENYDRQYYTGYLGIVDKENEEADYYVNLRCMQLLDNEVYLYAGGGVTAMSSPRAEREEVENKWATMSRIL